MSLCDGRGTPLPPPGMAPPPTSRNISGGHFFLSSFTPGFSEQTPTASQPHAQPVNGTAGARLLATRWGSGVLYTET